MTRNKPVSILEENPSQSPASHASTQKEHTMDIRIRIISHNIRYATESPFKGEERWPIRCPRLCSELVFNSVQPTTFICLQEVLHSQLVDIIESLNESSSPDIRWEYIGVGRDDGKQAGEYSPVIYRPSVWHLNWSETRWLSETPEIPSKGWDASCIRLVTVGNFTHVQTGRKVLVLSTHLDNDGFISRKESAKLILGGIETFSETNDASAVLLAGDFNSPPDDGAYQIMTSPDSIMEDIGSNVPKKKRHGNEMTFTSFGHVDNEPSRIDFIFSRKGDKVEYRTYAVLANRFDDGVYLSDHRACVADLVLH
ncbi:related to endonuclease/exonuclease/phosphatase family protein [Phialocephala subalpina]|uniref:Related to endonuclease/exonuclease/phosphatase family protein n=1 Tax=Phialocephala subalpina TaxID=576137 RepID=A0A1L7X8Q7_9HELO|nr:related to endonuclease/exonuclease/phosphatase family protein [Phialocephala subalpina]